MPESPSSQDVLNSLENFLDGEKGDHRVQYQRIFTHGMLHDFSPTFFEQLKRGYQVINEEMKEKS